MVRDGASGAFTSAATMPADVADAIEGGNGAPLVLARHSIVDDGSATDVVIVGFEAGGLGEPALTRGALPRAPGEVVIDDASGLDVGEAAVIGGTEFVVSGLTDRRTMFAGMPLVFLPIGDAQELVYRGQPLATAVLLDAPPSSVPDGFQLLEPADIADDATRPLERSISSVNLIRVLLWLVAGLIIGTMTYLSSLERRRDVAVLKAIGASTAQLGSSIALQGVFIALGAAVLAAGLQVVVAPVFPLDVSVPDRALLQVPAIAVAVSLVAGLVGLRKAVGVDPALAFSGPGA
jgi:putative ABC transport system permease protein